jgi:DNA replication protein DnaC
LDICDDFGLRKIDENIRLAIYQLLDGNCDTYRLSIIFTSQLPMENWYDYLTPGSQTESILDRLISAANRINLLGKSMRKLKNRTTFELAIAASISGTFHSAPSGPFTPLYVLLTTTI